MADHEPDPTQNTRDWVSAQLGSLKSEMRLLFVLSVAGNQLLGHLSLSQSLTALGGGAAGLKAVALLWSHYAA